MKITTSNFGELNVPNDNIITFENGIPGFKDNTKYVIINDEEDSPFCWLQSIEDPSLAFALVNPFLVHDHYDPNLPKSEVEKLGQGTDEDYSILSIVIIPEDVEQMRANLMAPIVINLKTKKGMQIIIDGDDYPVKYYLFKQLQKNNKK
ncbi:MAG TPA: flagellar assembly protein FliW [Epulopiscium sp.]|nr:flagellar assembly protein FliW [Candidatus Epulonipiscium sp.]